MLELSSKRQFVLLEKIQAILIKRNFNLHTIIIIKFGKQVSSHKFIKNVPIQRY